MGLEDFLKKNRGSIIALDTMAFIYLFEEENYVDTIKAIFENVEKGKLKAITSTLTVMSA